MGMRLAAIAILLVFGILRVPMEQHVTRQHEDAYFRGAKLDLELREKIGQMGFIAALSGFRSLVADALWIEAHAAWEKTEWGRMALLFDNVTALQPRVTMFWDMAAWHMAWNASVAVRDDPDITREVLRKKAEREYFDLGKDFLERGIRNNPDTHVLYEKMALLLRDKYQDFCGAAEYFRKAAEFPAAPGYEKRMAAYALAKCPGKEREAYEELVRIYNLGEQELDIPREQRIFKDL
jgi:hypothetical protein